MSQPKFDLTWLKQTRYAQAYGGGLHPGIINRPNIVGPLFWEQREREQQQLWNQKMADAIRNTQENKDG